MSWLQIFWLNAAVFIFAGVVFAMSPSGLKTAAGAGGNALKQLCFGQSQAGMGGGKI